MLCESHTQGLEDVKDFIIQSAHQQGKADNINSPFGGANIVNNSFDNTNVSSNPTDAITIFSD